MLIATIRVESGLAQIYQSEEKVILHVDTPQLKAKYLVLDVDYVVRYLRKSKRWEDIEARVRALEAERKIAALAKRSRRLYPLYKEVQEILKECKGYVTVDEIVARTGASKSSVARALQRLGYKIDYVIVDGRKKATVICT